MSQWSDVTSLKISPRRTVEYGSVVHVREARGQWRVTRIVQSDKTAVIDLINLSSGRIRYVHPEALTGIRRKAKVG